MVVMETITGDVTRHNSSYRLSSSKVRCGVNVLITELFPMTPNRNASFDCSSYANIMM